jgi:hypothetical protein
MVPAQRRISLRGAVGAGTAGVKCWAQLRRPSGSGLCGGLDRLARESLNVKGKIVPEMAQSYPASRAALSRRAYFSADCQRRAMSQAQCKGSFG